MKLYLFVSVLILSTLAHSSVKVICNIDAPCGWLEPIPGVTDHHLGYCVDRLEGDEKKLTVFRSDAQGKSLPSIDLIISEITKERLAAANDDGNVTLAVSEYSDFWAGGLLFKTKESPDGLGFFLACAQETN